MVVHPELKKEKDEKKVNDKDKKDGAKGPHKVTAIITTNLISFYNALKGRSDLRL